MLLRDSVKNNAESEIVTRTKYHKVKRGDKLGMIADRYNVTMSEIKKWNKLKGNKAFHSGRSLKIITTESIAVRTPKKATKVDTIAVAAVSKTENQASNAVAQVSVKEVPASKVYKEEKVVSFKDVTKIHKVKKGDNLSTISDKYGVAMADIKKWNKLKSNKVALGKSLKIITNEKVVTTVGKLVKAGQCGCFFRKNQKRSR